jgi:hypothetical protein
MWQYETAGITRLECKRCKKGFWWKIVLGVTEPDFCEGCKKQS